MRPWTEKVYGIPPEQVVGSSIKAKFEPRDGKPVRVHGAGADLLLDASRLAGLVIDEVLETGIRV